MKRRDPTFDLEFKALLERGKTVLPVPDFVRARSLARARSTVDGVVVVPSQDWPATRRRGLATAVAAAIAFVVGAGAAVGAFHVGALRSRPAVPAATPTQIPARRPSPLEPPSLALAADADTPTARRRPMRMTPAQESYAAELKLLQHAQAAYAHKSFGQALSLLAEHGRRFPSGHLTEEREALRVRALAKSGRTREADRAARAFAERFPRSVLLRPLDIQHP